MPRRWQLHLMIAAVSMAWLARAAWCGGPVLVPLDSWVYPALVRLAGLGYVADQPKGMRPWTRDECRRQIEAAREALARSEGAKPAAAEAARLIEALSEEFGAEDAASFVELESVYARVLGIAGRPLADGYNFGQTVINDYGRPLAGGANFIGGLSAVAVGGRWSFYARAEFQGAPPFASAARELEPAAEQIEPVLPETGGGTRRVRPLEVYAGAQFGAWSLTVGKQGLWWGPGASGPLSLSNNAEGFYSFRLTRTTPVVLPGPLARLGGFRLDVMGGRLEGHTVPRRPLVNGQRLSWRPVEGLEFGFTRWSLFGGQGVSALTLRSVARNLLANGPTGGANDPGDRKSGFDFEWRLPLAEFVTVYSDFYADDEPSPLASPRRSAFSPGIYLARLPKLARWDLRVEAPSSRLAGEDRGGTFLFWNHVYRSANTNYGRPLGNWVGRDGRGLFVQTSYWHGPRARLDFSYRQNRIGAAFLPGGGTQSAGAVSGMVELERGWLLEASMQLERYFIPVLGPAPRCNFTAALRVTWLPRWRLARR